jgi:hypothetical protein
MKTAAPANHAATGVLSRAVEPGGWFARLTGRM